MEKKDIYEHLAKIYLDASSKKKKKTKTYAKIFKNISIIIVFFVCGFIIALPLNLKKSKSYHSEVALVLLYDTAKVNFQFDPAKKETYSLDLKNLNLSKFKALGFSAKKTNSYDTISLRVEFINAFREKSEVYLKDIPHRWQDYMINLSEFKNISDWTEMTNLSFAIEEWNVRKKKGVVYLDNVRLLK